MILDPSIDVEALHDGIGRAADRTLLDTRLCRTFKPSPAHRAQARQILGAQDRAADLPESGCTELRQISEVRHALVAREISDNLLVLLAQLVTHALGSGADAL